MDDKLRRYIEGLFKDVPQTKSMVELKEEMLQNIKEKYEDLIGEGKTEEAAYNIAIAGIGDISSLINDMDKVKDVDYGRDRQRTATLTSVAVMIYILSIIPLLLFVNGTLTVFMGAIGFFIMIALATGLLIYNGMTKASNYKGDATMVEEFKEWQTNKSNKRAARLSISVALWSIIVAVYFIVSFASFAWHITWVLFIIGIAIEALINIVYISKK